jgi:hypothetical protein
MCAQPLVISFQHAVAAYGFITGIGIGIGIHSIIGGWEDQS